jgi:hypothetical protein
MIVEQIANPFQASSYSISWKAIIVFILLFGILLFISTLFLFIENKDSEK